MTYMPDEIVLASMMTSLDLKFEEVMHYHDEEYESDNDYGLQAHTQLGIPVQPRIPRPVIPSHQPNQMEMPRTPAPQLDQVVMHPEPELMELDIPEDIPDFIDVPEEVLLDFDAWAHSMLDYEW